MTILNFAHPLTPEQLAAATEISGQEVTEVLEHQAFFDETRPFAEQARELVESVGLSPADWQTKVLLVNLPSLSPIAAIVLAELHGRTGYFPAVIRMRRVPEATPTRFEVVEILDLQNARDSARGLR